MPSKKKESGWCVSYVDKNNNYLSNPIITLTDVLGKKQVFDLNKIIKEKQEEIEATKNRETLKMIKELLNLKSAVLTGKLEEGK